VVEGGGENEGRRVTGEGAGEKAKKKERKIP